MQGNAATSIHDAGEHAGATPDAAVRRPGRHRRRAVVAGLAVGLLAPLVACSSTSTTGSGGSTTSGTAKAGIADSGLADDKPAPDGGKLVIAVANETDGWNPTVNRWATWGAVVGSSVLEPLAILDDKAQPQPWLATKWEANAAYDSWTITLREGVTFHDGTPFDAKAVKTDLDDTVKAPLSGVAVGTLFKEVTVVDAHTVRVDLTQPWAAFPGSFMAGQSAMMRAPASIEAEDHGQKHPIGTGPFVFQEWKPDAYFRASKNPTYWRKGEPHVDSIEFRVISDESGQVNALKANDIDMAFTTSADAVEETKADFAIVKNYETEPTNLFNNTNKVVAGKDNPMSNVHARLALAKATDRHAIAALVGQEVTSPTSPFGASSPWGQADELNGYPAFDVDAAKQEVEAYKKDTGQSELQITLSGSVGTQEGLILQALQDQWRNAGINAEIESLEAPTLISRVISGNYQTTLFSPYTSPDPDQFWYFWSSTTAKGEGGININFSQYKSDTVDAALAIGRENPSYVERKKAYNDIVKEYNEQGINTWLYWTPYALVAKRTVHGLQAVATTPFATFQPKTWYGSLSIDH